LPSYKYINENLDTKSKEINNYFSDHLSYKFIDEKSFQDHLNNLNIDSNKAIVEYFIMNDCCVIFLLFKVDNSIKVSIEVIDDFNFIELNNLMINKNAEQYSGYLAAYFIWKEESEKSKQTNNSININKNFTNFCNEIDKISGTLYEKIFAPIKNLLDTNNITQIKFVPNNYFYSLPLHAMYKKCENGDKRYLIEDYEISYVPSLKILFETELKDIKTNNSILIISNPDYTLPSSDYETEKILALHNGAIVLSHKDASFNNVIGEMTKNFNIIHFACHGEYNFNDPMNSSLILHDDKLRISDIINVLNLRETKLITLSACETGLVKLGVTDEYLGLSGAFLISGAKSVVSSLWEVADYPTSLLMVKFYEEIYKNNLSPDIALAKAQRWLFKELTLQDLISLLENEIKQYPDGTTKNFLKTWYKNLNEKCDLSEKPFNHPYYWAPFYVSEAS
jgi:CHAT domain-containing protein